MTKCTTTHQRNQCRCSAMKPKSKKDLWRILGSPDNITSVTPDRGLINFSMYISPSPCLDVSHPPPPPPPSLPHPTCQISLQCHQTQPTYNTLGTHQIFFSQTKHLHPAKNTCANTKSHSKNATKFFPHQFSTCLKSQASARR